MGRRLAVMTAIVASLGVVAWARRTWVAHRGAVEDDGAVGRPLAGPASNTPSTTLWPTTSIPSPPRRRRRPLPPPRRRRAPCPGPLVPTTVRDLHPIIAFDGLVLHRLLPAVGGRPVPPRTWSPRPGRLRRRGLCVPRGGCRHRHLQQHDAPLPTYTVTDTAPRSASAATPACVIVRRLLADGGRLDTFTIDASHWPTHRCVRRPTTVEALTVDASFSLRRPRRGAQRRRPAGIEGRDDVLLGGGHLRRYRGKPVRHRPSNEPVPGWVEEDGNQRGPRVVRWGPAWRTTDDPDHHRPDTSCDDHPHSVTLFR